MSQQRRISEGSCLRCRKRRLRCNLAQPVCSRCQEAEEECNYGTTTQLKWVGGMAMRGHLARRSSKSSLTISAKSYDISPTSSSISTNLEESDLIVYFNHAILPRFQLPDRAIELNYDAVTQNESLQRAILAISRAHYAMNSKINGSDTIILRKRARQSAIESFRQLLQKGVADEVESQDLFTVNVLLCILEGVIEPLDEFNGSICHLRGGFALLSQWPEIPARMLTKDGLSAHLLSVFATMDLVHALLNGDRPFFESFTWHMFANTQTWFGTLATNDPFLTILKAYSEMGSLGHLLVASMLNDDSVALVDRCLANIEQVFMMPKKAFDDGSLSLESESHWSIFCSIYRISGTIYIERALRLKSVDDEAVQIATRRGVELLIDDVLPGMMSHCLVFPILVIGSHCIHSQDRRVVFEALSHTSSYLSFGSIELMTNFLRQLWDDLDVKKTWWKTFEPISDLAFLF